MSKKDREFIDSLRTTSVEAVAEVMEGLQRLKQLQQEIVDDGTGQPLSMPRLGDHFYQLAKFELEHAANLLRLGNSQAEMVFDQIRQLVRRKRGHATPIVPLTLSADSQRYEGQFEIRNPFDAPADARFVVPPLQNADGESSSVKVTAACGNHNRVHPHHPGHVTLTVDAALVAGDAQHPTSVTMFGEITVFLSVDVEQQVAHRRLKLHRAHQGHDGQHGHHGPDEER